MAKKPIKQEVQNKSTETDQIVVATVDLPEYKTADEVYAAMEELSKELGLHPSQADSPKTPEQAMDELVELSQELGLYDITDNPLVKDESTMPPELPTEAVESVQQEINATVAKEPEIDSSIATEPLNETEEVAPIDLTQPLPIGISIVPSKDEKQMVKNGWGEPLPSLVVTITKSYLRETVAELLYIASLGGELDTSMLPTIRIPFICKMLLPESKYQDYVDRKDYPMFEQEVSYNTVLVKSFDRFDFFKTLVSVGKTGGFIKPRSEVVSGSKLMAQVLTHQPVADTFSTKVGVEKVKYTMAELESFTIEQLRAIGEWYEIPSMNSKKNYHRQIMEKQNAR
jgi:hypothetical protein